MSKPTKELKSTPFTEVIELERIVTPDEEKRGDIPDLDEHREKIIKEFCN